MEITRMNRWASSIVLVIAALEGAIAQAEPVGYSFFGYVSRRDHISPWLPAEFTPGTAIEGQITFDPEREGNDPETGEPSVIAPIVALGIRSVAGGLVANPSGSVLRVIHDVNESLSASSGAESSGAAPFAGVNFTWTSHVGGQVPQNLADLAALQPNSWQLTLSSTDPACAPFCSTSDTVDVHIVMLTSGNPFDTLDNFSAPPSGWIDSGGSWFWRDGYLTNSANTAFTSTVYSGRELKRSFTFGADLLPEWRAAGNTLGLVFNYQDDDNLYELRLNALGTVTLNKVVNGTRSMIQTASYPVPPGPAPLRVLVQRPGNSIIASVEFQEVIRAEDSTHLRGRAGAFASWNKVRVDEFSIRQTPFWSVNLSRFENALGWVSTAGNWVAESGVLRNTTVQQAAISLARTPIHARRYAIHSKLNLQWSAAGNRGGLVYDYVDVNNYRAVLLQATGTLQLIEIKNGVRTVAGEGKFGLGAGQWADLSVIRFGSTTQVRGVCRPPAGNTCDAATISLTQPELVGSKRAGLLANWNHVRFDDTVVAVEN